jgi:hypothetical protein
MPCPECGNDVWLDAPHTCPPGFVKPAREIKRFYSYQSLNRCCRDWLLLGWPADRDEHGVKTMTCGRCGKDLHFDLDRPGAVSYWDESTMGKPDPPTVIAGRIK